MADGPNYDAKKIGKFSAPVGSFFRSLSMSLRFPAEPRSVSFTGGLEKERKREVTLAGAAFTSYPDPGKGLEQ